MELSQIDEQDERDELRCAAYDRWYDDFIVVVEKHFVFEALAYALSLPADYTWALFMSGVDPIDAVRLSPLPNRYPHYELRNVHPWFPGEAIYDSLGIAGRVIANRPIPAPSRGLSMCIRNLYRRFGL
jgi:hypothetical protein